MQIHQVLPALSYGDAVSNHAIEIRAILRKFGYDSNIYAKYIHPKVSKFGKSLDKYEKNAANIVIYHFSLAGLDVSDFVRRLPDTKVLIYHNITPRHYFNGINDTVYDLCKRGREELKIFNGITKLALGDSEYNRQELARYDFKDTGVLPIIIDYSKYETEPDKKTMRRYDNSGYVNLLFVGRISPNKRIDDLIRIFYYYKKINPKSRLFIVGSYEGMEKYFARLQELVKRLGLTDVVFTGQVSFEEMIAYYRMADVFICMSEHEGFCVPLLESMYFNIPIIAYNSTAVPFTLANCGILVNEKCYDEIAEIIHLLISDDALRKKIVEGQNERLKDFERSKMEEKIKKYIEYLINSAEKEEISLKNKFEKYPFVSVIICTYNRAKYLERCIESLKKQTYLNFEIIVVNGPSTDETDQVLKKYPKIRVVRQEELNGLSFARNLGITVSIGEIIAFIDDDAVADENWINHLVDGYTDESVGGVGGLVYGPQKAHLQFDRGTINKCAIPTAIRNKDGGLRKDEFSIIMGTNSSFRKDILYEVGGFDPYFRYYHDESDLCIRIAKKGYRIVYQRDAFVIHDMLEGHNRKSPYDLNWSEIMKNAIYFTLKNFRGEFLSYTVRPAKSLFWWLKYFISPYLNKDISLKQLFDIYLKLVRGAIRGYKDGLKVKENKNSLADIPTLAEKKLKICFLSQEFTKNCNGGVCKYTYDLAHALAESGNEVHVISKSEKDHEYEYRDGKVFVHEIIPESIDFLALPDDMEVSKKNLSHSYSACLKLLELIDNFGIQIVEAPLWDGEGFVFSLITPIPLVVRLETPLFKVAEIQGWQLTKDLKFVNWMEGETIRRADKAIAISKDIGTVISNHHTIAQEKIELCPLGIEVPDENLLLKDQKKNVFDVLFVGRLEKRKGVETLFKAIPMVLEKVPDTQFYIVGKDTNLAPNGGSYRKYLLQNLDKRYHKNVKFVGYVDDNTLKNYYRNCDIFVAPSLYESFGLIYLEAMAWRKSVIGCDAGGVPEIVEDGETGILIPPEDENALAEAIIKLKDEKSRAKMGENGRKRVKNDFLIKKMAENTYEIYKNVIHDLSAKDSNSILDENLTHPNPYSKKLNDMMNNAVKLDTKIINKINKHVSKYPFEYYPICELTNPNKWYSSEWAKLQEDLKTPIYYPPNFIHRKSWEWIQCIYGLEKLGVLNDNSIGLGVSVGHEPLIYFFSNKVKHIVATDLYDEKSIWMTSAEGDPEILSDIDKFAPFPYKKERLEIKIMDGRKLEFPENTFDFIWSCSSIEHYGGHKEAAKSMKEMERVLKTGGILALATEFVIDQDIIPGFKSEHPHFFNLEALYKYLIASHNLKLVQNINFSLSAYYIKNHIKLPEESQSPHMSMHRKPHIVLCQDNVLFTSIFMFFRKKV